MDVQQQIQPTDFSDENRRKLAEIYWEQQRHDGEPQFNALLGLLDDPQLKELALSLFEEVEALSNVDQMLEDALAHLQKSRRRTDQNKLVAQLRRSDSPAEDEAELLRKLQERAREPDIRRSGS
jgi:hypothetical protein